MHPNRGRRLSRKAKHCNLHDNTIRLYWGRKVITMGPRAYSATKQKNGHMVSPSHNLSKLLSFRMADIQKLPEIHSLYLKKSPILLT